MVHPLPICDQIPDILSTPKILRFSTSCLNWFLDTFQKKQDKALYSWSFDRDLGIIGLQSPRNFSQRGGSCSILGWPWGQRHMGPEAECCCLLQDGQEEYGIPWSDIIGSCNHRRHAHTPVQPPAGTKGPEAPARAPVPAFPGRFQRCGE